MKNSRISPAPHNPKRKTHINKGSNYKAKTKGVKYEAGTKHNDFIQAETQNAKYEAETKHTDILQAKTRGAKYKAGTKPTNILQAETKGVNDLQ